MDNINKQDNNENYDKNKKLGYCGNCGKIGHRYKNCREPIISYGIILINLKDTDKLTEEQIKVIFDSSENKINISAKTNGVRCMNNSELNMFSYNKDKVKFLLIQRKHSLGYSEFIRGRYVVENIDGIIFLFQQMTPSEIEIIGKSEFSQLWDEFWHCGIESLDSRGLSNEYLIAKDNFEKLKTAEDLNLDYYIKNVVPKCNSPEWGFPKGRRNHVESDMDCAIREFEEETNITSDKYILLKNIDPLVENFVGTNGKKYRHVYYLALSYNTFELNMDSIHQKQEIGNIGLFCHEDTMNLIRPYHIERKKILTTVFTYILNTFVNRCEDIMTV